MEDEAHVVQDPLADSLSLEALNAAHEDKYLHDFREGKTRVAL